MPALGSVTLNTRGAMNFDRETLASGGANKFSHPMGKARDAMIPNWRLVWLGIGGVG